MNNINSFLNNLSLSFNDEKLLKEALTHKSYANENNLNYDYERLEFLGDSLLSKITAEMIFRKYPQSNEGEMSLLRSSLLNGTHLAEIGRKILLNKIILTGKSKDNKNNDKIIEDVFEAFVGALYIDQGEEIVKVFLEKYLFKNISISENINKNPKTLLQEFLQAESREIIEYKTRSQGQEFISQIYHDGNLFGTGKGKSKKEAEVNAALDALKRMGKK